MKRSNKLIFILCIVLASLICTPSCSLEMGKTYTITYDANGADDGSVPADQSKIGNLKLTLASNTGNLVRDKYVFGGWNTQADGKGTNYAEGAAFTDNADTTLYAKWIPDGYTITYDVDEGTNHTNNPATYTIETETIELLAATRTGYTFVGWYDAESEGNKVTHIEIGSSGDITLYARWEIKSYTISYDKNDATGGTVPGGHTAEHGTLVTLATNSGNLSRNHYTFGGWNTRTDGRGTDYAVGGDFIAVEDTVLYAKWNAQTYEITYDLDDGDNAGTNPLTYTIETATFALEDATKTGYSFIGWFDIDKEKVEVIHQGSTGAIILEAHWQINQYTISFNSAGGSSVDSIVQDYGTAVIEPDEPTKNGYTFNDWEPVFPATMPAENLTLTAQWDTNTYTIAYELHDGTNDNSNPTTYTIEEETIELVDMIPVQAYQSAGIWCTLS
jgi:uncharacterized repeat protein (TIGR02543 family)